MPKTVTLSGYRPSERYDGNAWEQARIEGAESKTGPWAEIEVIALSPVDSNPENPQTRGFTTTLAELEQNWFRVVFLDGDENEELTEPVTFADFAFASIRDVAVRLKRTLTDQEEFAAEFLLEAATANICVAVDKDEDWAIALSPVPKILRFMCVELVVRALSNPENLSTYSQTLGAYSYAKNFANSRDFGSALMPTEIEERMLRNVVYGRTAHSARAESVIDDFAALKYSDEAV